MRTFTFSDLSDRAKEAVNVRYSQLVDEAITASEGAGQVPDNETIKTLFEGWRFNEHGERIA